MKMYWLGLLLVVGLMLQGCQTNQLRAFSKIKKGMDKSEVLEIMGSPQRSQRWMGRDRWSYIFVQSDQSYTKELVFNGGKVIYAGGPIRAGLTAEEQDRQNEIANKQIEKALDKRRADYKRLYPGGPPKSSPATGGAPAPTDSEDQSSAGAPK